jgi:hypothetical protein
MFNPKYLDLTVKQAQGNVSLTNMSDSKNLNLTVSLVNMS